MSQEQTRGGKIRTRTASTHLEVALRGKVLLAVAKPADPEGPEPPLEVRLEVCLEV